MIVVFQNPAFRVRRMKWWPRGLNWVFWLVQMEFSPSFSNRQTTAVAYRLLAGAVVTTTNPQMRFCVCNEHASVVVTFRSVSENRIWKRGRIYVGNPMAGHLNKLNILVLIFLTIHTFNKLIFNILIHTLLVKLIRLIFVFD